MHKRVLVLTVVALLATTLAWAGGDHGKKKAATPAEHATHLQKELGLTDAQTQQVTAVFEDINARYMALKEQGLEKEAFKAEKKKLKEEKMTRIQGILTAEQWARLEEMRTKEQGTKQAKRDE